jgi:hypothetical protein
MVEVSRKRVLRTTDILNTTQVARSIRHDSGIKVGLKMKRSGFKRLQDLGYEEVCQYRACQHPVGLVDATYGEYCSTEHLQLAAADIEEATLYNPANGKTDLGAEKSVNRKRRAQLRNAAQGVVDKPSNATPIGV